MPHLRDSAANSGFMPRDDNPFYATGLFLYPLKTSELYSQIIQHMAIYRQPTWSHKKNINFNSLLSNQISGNWSAGWWDSMSLKYTFNANKWTSSHLWLMSMQKIYIFWSVVLVFIMNFVVIVTFHAISGIFSLKKSVWPLFYGWGSTALRLQSHYEETAYFFSFSSQEFLVLNWSTSEGWKTELTLE